MTNFEHELERIRSEREPARKLDVAARNENLAKQNSIRKAELDQAKALSADIAKWLSPRGHSVRVIGGEPLSGGRGDTGLRRGHRGGPAEVLINNPNEYDGMSLRTSPNGDVIYFRTRLAYPFPQDAIVPDRNCDKTVQGDLERNTDVGIRREDFTKVLAGIIEMIEHEFPKRHSDRKARIQPPKEQGWISRLFG